MNYNYLDNTHQTFHLSEDIHTKLNKKAKEIGQSRSELLTSILMNRSPMQQGRRTKKIKVNTRIPLDLKNKLLVEFRRGGYNSLTSYVNEVISQSIENT